MTATHAGSDFLSVRHGPAGHQQMLKRQGLTAIWRFDGNAIFRAVTRRRSPGRIVVSPRAALEK